MSLVEHSISLDLITPRSVDPLLIFSDNLAAYSIIARITQNGQPVDLSNYRTAQLIISGASQFPTGQILSDRVVFELAGAPIREDWSICSVRLTSNSGVVAETQSFQILKQVNAPIQVDASAAVTLTREELLKLVQLANVIGLEVYNDDYSIIPHLDFTTFTETNRLANSDSLPFLHDNNGTTEEKKITWANLMAQFTETHRTEYIPITITKSNWGSNKSCNITVPKATLDTKNLTADQVVDANDTYHTHAHIHPEPASVLNYANYGVYCSAVVKSGTGVRFTFQRNSTYNNMPTMNLTVEVRLG